jgi:predicted DNA-binding transcriptional regulator AlpA
METVLLKVHDVMNRLSVGQTKVYELMSSGELRSVKSAAPAACRVTSSSVSWPNSTTPGRTSVCVRQDAPQPALPDALSTGAGEVTTADGLRGHAGFRVHSRTFVRLKSRDRKEADRGVPHVAEDAACPSGPPPAYGR